MSQENKIFVEIRSALADTDLQRDATLFLLLMRFLSKDKRKDQGSEKLEESAKLRSLPSESFFCELQNDCKWKWNTKFEKRHEIENGLKEETRKRRKEVKTVLLEVGCLGPRGFLN